MNSDKRLMAEIADLVIHSLNDTLEQHQLNHLENLLENNPLAVKYYTEVLTVHTSLYTIEGMAGLISSGCPTIKEDLWNSLLLQEKTYPSIELEQEKPDTSIEIKPKNKIYRINRFSKLSLIAALISIASLISFAIIGQKSLKPLTPHAVITAFHNVELDNPLFDYKVGDKVADNTINLDSGLLKLEMNDGTDLVLQGPCSFSLESDSQVQLYKGKLTAKVPQKAIGFTVRTPSASIVDYGTEFAVSVDKYAMTEAHVSKGVVELRLGSDKYNFNQSLRLTKNQAGKISGTNLKLIPASLNNFTYDTPSKFETAVKNIRNNNLYIRALNDNPDCITEIRSNSNDAFSINPDINIIPGPKFNNNKSIPYAIQFSGPDKMISFNNLSSIPQSKNGSYTVGFWLKLDKLGEQLISHGKVKGVNVYDRAFIVTKDGKIQHCAYDISTGRRWRIAENKISLKPDTWYMVMVSRNMRDDSKKLFINGKLAANNTVSKNQRTKKIAQFNTINFGGDLNDIKGFDGALSEIMMFSRALDENEIKHLYQSALKY